MELIATYRFAGYLHRKRAHISVLSGLKPGCAAHHKQWQALDWVRQAWHINQAKHFKPTWVIKQAREQLH